MTTKKENVKHRLKSSGLKAANWFFDYISTWSLMLMTLFFVKVTAGTHRPFFITACQPSAVNCTIGTLVTDYTCTNPRLTPKYREIISSSFPSGHSCTAAYFSIFIIYYIHRRIPKLRLKYIVPTIQNAFLSYMMICGLSRIADKVHHPVDVLFGTLMGMAYAIFNASIWTLISLLLT